MEEPMNEQSNAPLSPMPSGPIPIYQVWMNALTKPNEQTYAEMAASPNAKSTTAFLWVFIGSLVNFLIASLVQGAVMGQMMRQFGGNGQFQFGAGGIGNRLITIVCGAPIAAVIWVVIFAAMVGIVQFIAKAFGGRGTFDQMSYTSAAIWTPFTLIASVLTLLSAIPYVGLCFSIVSLVALLYVLFLAVTAVKGVNQVGWGQAAGSCLLPVVVLCCCLSAGVYGIIQVLGPAINDTFNSINQSLTP
jgi:Yip1 domain